MVICAPIGTREDAEGSSSSSSCGAALSPRQNDERISPHEDGHCLRVDGWRPDKSRRGRANRNLSKVTMPLPVRGGYRRDADELGHLSLHVYSGSGKSRLVDHSPLLSLSGCGRGERECRSLGEC
jgi:hypothetical protein